MRLTVFEAGLLMCIVNVEVEATVQLSSAHLIVFVASLL